MKKDDYIKMDISGLTVDPLTNSPIVILKEIDGNKTLPIWIGLLEATAIASELEGIRFSRPMTHDLLNNLLQVMGIDVTKIEVCDLKDNTYYALIHFRKWLHIFIQLQEKRLRSSLSRKA